MTEPALEPMPPDEIETRRRRIGLSHKDLARRSERHINTVKNLLAGHPVHGHTRAAVVGVLAAEELSLRDYLLGIHPLEPKKTEVS